MLRRLSKDEAGYSLIEVTVSILLLSIAIIPMVAMFDAGLRAAVLGGNYDKARSFANERLEYAKGVPYADARDRFPVTSSTPAAGTGSYTSSTLALPDEDGDGSNDAGLPEGSTYTIAKQYVFVPPGDASTALGNSTGDSNMIRLTVTVQWSDNDFTTSGVVSGGL